MLPNTSAGDSPSPLPLDVPKHHPRGLAPIFMTEMWERFSYYGMRALLTGYLVSHLGWLPGEASTVYKWYTSLVYLTPLLGGFLADRYLGLRTSIIAGAALMTVGHILMIFEPMPIFYAALGCLIVANGLFKPNMSTLVGRMYYKNDPRRDAAFTIFYMGINLGAFLSPLVCGKLREHYGYHPGFAAAGVGMTFGLAWFLLRQGQIKADVEAVGNSLAIASPRSFGPRESTIDEDEGRPAPGGIPGLDVKANPLAGPQSHGPRENAIDEDERRPACGGIPGLIARAYPVVFMALGLGLPAWYATLFLKGALKSASELIMPIAYGLVFVWMGATLLRIKGAARDKSTCIFIFFIFAVLFWMAFEQAGNALNIWALYNTRLTFLGYTYPAEWWQSINAVLIVAIAPLASKLWSSLGPREPSTATKMLLALGFMAAAFLCMVAAAWEEDRTTSTVPLAALPATHEAAADGTLTERAKTPPGAERPAPIDAGRLRWDREKKLLVKQGVLGDYLTLNLLTPSVPEEWKKEVEALEKLAEGASEKNPVTVLLDKAPPSFALPAEGAAWMKGATWNAATRTLTLLEKPSAPLLNNLRVSGGDSSLRDALRELEVTSLAARASGFWLFLEYLFATLGELCLSPVGLSMVTKLAPLRFSSLFMGVWLLSSSVAQYVGGALGEQWGVKSPAVYFELFVLTSLAGFVVLLLLIHPIKKLMHDVK